MMNRLKLQDIWQWSDITLIMYVKDSPAVLKDIEQQEMILGKVFWL